MEAAPRLTFSFIIVVRACSRACSCPTCADSSTSVLLRFSFLACEATARECAGGSHTEALGTVLSVASLWAHASVWFSFNFF